MEKYKPLNDLVLLKPDPFKPYNEYKGLSKIVVPDVFSHGPEDRPVWGKVVATGPTCRLGYVQIGDRVVIGKWAGAWVELNGRKHILVREYDILAKEVK